MKTHRKLKARPRNKTCRSKTCHVKKRRAKTELNQARRSIKRSTRAIQQRLKVSYAQSPEISTKDNRVRKNQAQAVKSHVRNNVSTSPRPRVERKKPRNTSAKQMHNTTQTTRRKRPDENNHTREKRSAPPTTPPSEKDT